MKRLLGSATIGLMLLAACGGSAAPSPAASTAPSAPASAAPASAAASPAASAASAPASAAAKPSTATSAAASPAASGKVEVIFWHTQSGANQMTLNDFVSKFNASHPNINVTAQYVGNYDDEYQKLLSAAKAGGLPDVAVAYENVVADLMKANAVVPLDQYVNDPQVGLSKDSQADIFPGFVEDNKYKQFNNQMLSFPFTKSVVMSYYNTDLMTAAGVDKIPVTWDDYSTAMKRVTDYAKSKNMPWNGAEAYNPDASSFDFEVMSRGGALISDDQSHVLFNNDQAVAALTMHADLAKAGASYMPQGFDWENDLAAQKNLTRSDSSTSYSFIDPLIAKAPKPFKYAAAMPPNAAGQKVTVMYGANVALFKSTPQKQAAAWEFIKWFTDTDQTAAWSIKSHYLPVRQSASKSADFTKELAGNPTLKASFEALPYARPEPAAAGWQQVRDIILAADTAVFTGKAQPKAALDDAAKKADKALADAK